MKMIFFGINALDHFESFQKIMYSFETILSFLLRKKYFFHNILELQYQGHTKWKKIMFFVMILL